MSDISNLKISKIEKEKLPVKELGSEKTEKISIPEKSFESKDLVQEKKPFENFQIKTKEGELGLGKISAAVQVTDVDREREKAIEKILEKDLEEMYVAMSPEKKKEFKILGEETAREINKLLKNTKVKVKKIIDLIRRWLLIIPGVNKFFIEQEVKIKTDEIMKINFLKKY